MTLGGMTDVIVIGGGIAGVSAAASLAADGASVELLEAERHLAFHTTGRSAALYFESYGHPTIRALSKASRRWFEDPPAGTTDGPLLSPRGALMIAPADQVEALETSIAQAREHGTEIHRIAPADAVEMVPTIRQEKIVAASHEPGAADMDVAAIHQAFVRQLRRAGGLIHTGAGVTALRRTSTWHVTTGSGGHHQAPVVVDAAGAWCDEVAVMAGARPVGLVPKRRTVFMVTAPVGSSHWPLVATAGHTFYFKPEGTQLLCSPADETPSAPCDARPDEVDIASAIERINEATNLGIRSVRSSWAGLRSFVPDGGMVIGFDDDVDGFFWLAGQGGTGIQTSPAAGALAADLIADRTPAVDPSGFDVARFR